MEGRIQGRSGTSRPGESAAIQETRSGSKRVSDLVAVSETDIETASGTVVEDRRVLEGEGRFHAAVAPEDTLDGSSRGVYREYQR